MHQDDLQHVTLCYTLRRFTLRQTNLSFRCGLASAELWLSSTAGRFHFHLISASALRLLALHQRPFVPVSPPSHTVSHQEAAGSSAPFILFSLLILLSFLSFSVSLSLLSYDHFARFISASFFLLSFTATVLHLVVERSPLETRFILQKDLGDSTLSITSAVFCPFKQTTHLINGLWNPSNSITLPQSDAQPLTLQAKALWRHAANHIQGHQKMPSIKGAAHFRTFLFSCKRFIHYSGRYTLFARSITAARLDRRGAPVVFDPRLPHGAAVSPGGAERGTRHGVKTSHKSLCVLRSNGRY